MVSAVAKLEERGELCRNRGWEGVTGGGWAVRQTGSLFIHPYLHCPDLSQEVLIDSSESLAVASAGVLQGRCWESAVSLCFCK